MKRAILSFAVLCFLSSIAHGSGGSTMSGHPLIDARKGKQEAKASAVVPATGAVVVTGFQNLTSDGNDDLYAAKYAADGSIVWRVAKDFAGGSDQGAAVVIDKWGDAIVAATIMNGGGYDVHLVRYRDNGTGSPTQVWSRTWSGAGTAADVAQALAYDPVSDRVYLAGYTGNGTNDDYLLLAFDNNRTGDNAPLWERTYDGGNKDRAYAVAVSTDGATIAVTGESSNGTGLDIATIMWQADGTRIGVWPKGGPTSFNDRGTALAFTATGHAVVTGYLTNGRGGDLYTAELSPASATPVWEATYDAGFDDQAVAVAVDAVGDVYVAATIGTLPAFSKLSAVKYHNNGTQAPDIVWNTTFDGGSANASGAIGLTVDSTGVFIAGWRDYSGIKKVLTMKVSCKTGRILWNKEWSGVTGNNSLPVGIGQAGQGIVTGAWTDHTQPLDGGTRAATGGSKTSLQNSGRTWVTDEWAGYSLYMVSSQNKDVFRRIQGNNATTLSLAAAEALPYAVSAGDLYYIYDKDDIDLLVLRQEKGVLDPPTGLTTEVLSNSSVRLSFQDNSETETSFMVDVKIGTGNWTSNAHTIPTPDQAGMNTVSYDVSGLTPDTEYYFRVRAYDNSTYSDYSTEAGALTRVVNFSAPALTYVYGDPAKGDDLATDTACYSGGAVVFTGTVFSDPNGASTPSKDYYTIKLNRTDFTTLWKDQRDGGYDEDDEIVALAVDQNRETVVTGTSMQNVPGTGNIPSVWTLKYAFSPAIDGVGEADPAWMDQLNSSGRLADQSDVVAVQGVSPYAIAITGHGHADITNINLFVRKLSATGTVQFTAEKDLGGNEFPAAAAVDGSGNVIVAGRVEKATGNDWFTAKFDGVTGDLLWSDTYGGTGDNQALSLTIDANNDVYVTGYVTDNTTGYTRMATIKYWGNASGTADRRWIAPYPTEQGTASFAARKIAFDPFANELVVAGDGYSRVTDRDLVVLRYDTAGNLLKQTELQNPGSDDLLSGLAIDPSGYVFLGADSGASPNTNIIAAIYTSSLDYVKSFIYNGAANRNDHAAAIAVNKFGEGFIAGHTTTADGDKDFLALKVVNDLVTMPYGATATPQADATKVDLGWSNVTSGAIPSIMRSVKDSGVWVAPPGTIGGQLNANAATFTDTGLNPNTTYCWRISATFNSVTTRYTEVCSTTSLTAPTIDAYTDVAKTSVRIQWSNVASNTGFRLERKTDTGGTWQTVATLPANTVSYPDSGLSAGTTYYYRLSVQNLSNTYSLPSAELMVPTMPEPITNGWIDHYATSSTTLTIRSYTSMSTVTGYRVERKTGADGTWATVGTIGTYPLFNDSGLTPNTTYYYRYFSVYKTIENPTPSAEIAVTTWLNPPTLQSATATNTTTINGSWAQVAGNSGYELRAYGCTGSVSQITANPSAYCSSYLLTTNLGTDVTSGTVTVPEGNYRAYHVSVKVKNGGGSSADSNKIVIFMPLAVSVTNVDIPAASQLRPTWTNTTEDYFDVQRRIPPVTDWTTVAPGLAANTLSWTDTTVANGTQYCYRIRAYAAAGGPADAYSAESCKTAQAPPNSPSLTLSTPTETTVRFDWNNTNFPTATNFDIYVRSYGYDSGGLPETFGSYWSAPSMVTTVTCATENCSYTYTTSRGAGITGFVRMSFYGTTIDSQLASPAEGYVQTMPNPPAVSSVTFTESTATITYGRINEAYSYKVYFKKAADGGWTGPLSVERNWTTVPYTITGLLPATQYQFKMESMGKTTESNNATVKTQWTLCTAPAITSITGVTANQATVTWGNSEGATSYKLERSADNATWTIVTNQNVLSYPDTGLTAGVAYWYRVRAVNGGGDSAPSASVQVVMVPSTPEDPMPRQLSDSSMELTFHLVKGASSYKIYRRDGGPAAAQTYIRTADIAYKENYCGSAYPTLACTTTQPTTTIVIDAGLQPNTVYCYAVAAANANGDSAIGQQLCGQTSAMGAPTVTVTAQAPFAATVSWTPGPAAVPIDGHVVEAIESDGTARTLAQVPMPAASFTDKSGLAPGAKRTYRVRPYRRFFDDFTAGLSLTDWAPWGRHRHGDGNEDFTTPPVDATDVDGTVRVSWDPSGKAELYTQVPGGILTNSYNYAQIGLNRTDLFTGDFDINYDFTIDLPNQIPDSMTTYNIYNRLRIYFPNSAGGTLRNDVGFGYNNSTGGPYFDSIKWVRGSGTTIGSWYLGEKLPSNGIKASRRGKSIHYYRKAGSGWSLTASNTEASTMTPDYVWIVTFNNRSNPGPTELRTLIDNVEVISYGTASTPMPVTMPGFDGNTNYCPQ